MKQEHSIAWEITSDYKKQNIALKVLLGLSIISNIVLILVLK